MLRHLNIDAKLAAVVDPSVDRFDPELKTRQFHRIIVAVPLVDSGYKFYTTTDPALPAGQMPWYLEGGSGLIFDGSLQIITIPYSSPDSSLFRVRYDLILNDNLSVSGRLQSEFTGHEAWVLRTELIDVEPDQSSEIIRERIGQWFDGVDVVTVELSNGFEPDSALRASCALDFSLPVSPGNHVMFKPFDYFISYQENPLEADERKGVIQFPYAYKLHESANIALPSGWSIKALPSDTVFTNRIGRCGVRFDNRGDTLFCERLFRLDYPSWSPDDYNEIKKLYRIRREFFEQIVVLANEG